LGNKNEQKIVLTSDEDLIKEGVQAIDDKFLEWFVKNPSCEEVDFIKIVGGNSIGNLLGAYEIIIPKEEPKQDFPMQKLIYIMENDEELKPKQETVEEAASRVLYSKYPYHSPQDSGYLESMFAEGVKWQQERSYTEKEVRDIVWESRKFFHDYKDTPFNKVRDVFYGWFEQFKKK
jgi:hypothetical protein